MHAAHTRAQVVLEPLISLADERSITHAIAESSPHLHPDATAGVLRPAAAAAACATVAALGGRVEPRGIAQSLDCVLVQDPPQGPAAGAAAAAVQLDEGGVDVVVGPRRVAFCFTVGSKSGSGLWSDSR